jgi:hypothetical protein
MSLYINIRLSLIIVTDEKEEFFITKITRNLQSQKIKNSIEK